MQRVFYCVCAVLLVLPAAVRGQDAATLSGTVVDSSQAVIPAVEITVTNSQRGIIRRTETAEDGVFVFDSLLPGEYKLEVSKAGFNKVTLDHVQLNVRDRQTIRLQLHVSPAATAPVTVTAEVEGISKDISAGAAFEHGYSQELPINGRDLQGLVRMSPGVISGIGPEFNVNGLRSNTNYYSVDGVSANRPLDGGSGFEMGSGSSMPGVTPVGGGGGPGMESIPLDSMQEVRVQTSTFAPEFGRSPGAQISMLSRSGSNRLHGSLAEYFRNERMNANDWFANSRSNPRGKMRQDRFGAVLGGPVVRDRTFFFVAYDGLRLQTPRTAIVSVPDLSTRRSAPAILRPFLNAFPVPNGPSGQGGAAEFHAGFSDPSSFDAWNARVDHRFNDRWNAFLRYSDSRSDGVSRNSEVMSPNVSSSRGSKFHTLTGSVVTLLNRRTTNDLRLNYSRSQTSSSSAMDNFGGAIPLAAGQVLPGNVGAAQGQFSLTVVGLSGYSIGSTSRNRQAQFNVVDALTRLVGRHHYKIGADYRRTMPTEYRKPYSATVAFNGLAGNIGSLTSGFAVGAAVAANEPAVYPLYVNFSLYAQDSYSANERTTLIYGLRWDVNPAPGVRTGPQPYALSNTQTGAVAQHKGLYNTGWLNVAPRLGLAYQLDPAPGRETVFRMGAGAFFDMGYGTTSGAFNGAPYSSINNMTLVGFPLRGPNLEAPVLPPTRPFGQVNAADLSLKSPVVFQWNGTLERAIGKGQVLSIGYTGTSGRRLLLTQVIPAFTGDYNILRQTTNGATSVYHGLQVQFRRRMGKDLQMQAGYTWGRSIDTASTDMGVMGGFATFLNGNRGDSDYDVRHNLAVSGSYRMPVPRGGMLRTLLGGWNADWVATARTGFPFDIQGISSATSNNGNFSPLPPGGGVFAQVRPNYNGLPVWIPDRRVAGGRRLNPNAFEMSSGYQQGNLGRNSIRGFPATQVDFSLRRQIVIAESWRLQLAAQAYNALNHPNFADPSLTERTNMSGPSFGVATRMLNQRSGGGGSVYTSGGPRSLELTLRLEF